MVAIPVTVIRTVAVMVKATRTILVEANPRPSLQFAHPLLGSPAPLTEIKTLRASSPQTPHAHPPEGSPAQFAQSPAMGYS